MRQRALVAVIALMAAIAPHGPAPAATPQYRAGDTSRVALSILPPGQGKHLSVTELALLGAAGIDAPHTDDQREMYDALVHAAPGLTDFTMRSYFKDASFGIRPGDVASTHSPRPGVTILRDRSFGVPRVYGETRSDVLFGVGYVMAEERLFYADTFRHVGRGRLSEFLGASDANLASDRSVRRYADYTEAELQAQFDALPSLDPEFGALYQADLTAMVDGLNARIVEIVAQPLTALPVEYVALQQLPKPFTITDVMAGFVFASWGFSGPMDGQLQTAKILDGLAAAGFEENDARAILSDFRGAEDPETPFTADDTWTLNTDLGPVDPAAVARPDPPSAAALAAALAPPPGEIDGPLGKMSLYPWPGKSMSNFLAVSSSLSASGRPLLVGGPQVGYQFPSILQEIEMHGPGIHARGVTFPGLLPYPGGGRGAHYAFTGTAPSVDQGDLRAVALCDPSGGTPSADATHYLRDGTCLPMDVRTDTWLAKPSAGGQPTPGNPDAVVVSETSERTVLGIVAARGTVGGRPVAFVHVRPTRGNESTFGLSFIDLVNPEHMQTVDDMLHALARGSFAGNMIVMDRSDIAYITTGTIPKLAFGVDPDLPFWGDSQWDYRGNLTFDEMPKSVNPSKGYITNWNNPQALGFRGPAGSFGPGPVHRSLLLDDGLHARASDGLTLVEVLQAAQEGATQDLRGTEVLPYLLEAIGTPDDPRLQHALGLLAAWRADGSHRRDLDLDGAYEHAAAVALIDRWWGRAVEAVFAPVLGDGYALMGNLVRQGLDRTTSRGSAGQVQKDLRTLLGHPVDGPYSRVYCGAGEVSVCRDRLTASLDAAVASLEAEYGADPTAWDAQEGQIRFVGLSSVVVPAKTGALQDRSTYQQVMEFS